MVPYPATAMSVWVYVASMVRRDAGRTTRRSIVASTVAGRLGRRRTSSTAAAQDSD